MFPAGVNTEPRGILKQISDQPNLTWTDLENNSDPLFISISKRPEFSVIREFINSMQGDMDFVNCFTSFSFVDQIVTSSISLLIQGPLFSYAHIEVGGCASYALLHTGIKIWCSTTTNRSSRLLERCFNNANNFIDFFQRGPREKEANYLRFTIQRPGDLIYIPSLRAHAVLTLDSDRPTILSGWDASTIVNSNVITRTLDEYNVWGTTCHLEKNSTDTGQGGITQMGVFASKGPSNLKRTTCQTLDVLGGLLFPSPYLIICLFNAIVY